MSNKEKIEYKVLRLSMVSFSFGLEPGIFSARVQFENDNRIICANGYSTKSYELAEKNAVEKILKVKNG